MYNISKTILIERDVDEDRYISPENFELFLRQFKTFSKYQFFFLLLGLTGWRPNELCKARIDDFDITNPNDLRVKWKLSKPTQFYKNEYLVKRYKIKWRKLPSWFGEIFKTYIKQHIFEIGGSNGYIFPSREKSGHIEVRTMETVLQRKRNELHKKDIIKWSWVKEPYQVVIYPNGRKQPYYKISLYSFRKLHATQFARELLNRGFVDILLTTAQHMGHTNPKTTLTYIKQLIDEKPIVNSAYKKPSEFAFNMSSMPVITKDQKKLSDF